MDPYCPLVAHTRLPDNANLVAPKGGAAGSMPINTPEVPLSSLAFLLDDFSFQVSVLALSELISEPVYFAVRLQYSVCQKPSSQLYIILISDHLGCRSS